MVLIPSNPNFLNKNTSPQPQQELTPSRIAASLRILRRLKQRLWLRLHQVDAHDGRSGGRDEARRTRRAREARNRLAAHQRLWHRCRVQLPNRRLLAQLRHQCSVLKMAE